MRGRKAPYGVRGAGRLVIRLAPSVAVLGVVFPLLPSGHAATESTAPLLGPGESATTWFVFGVSADRRQLLVAATSSTPTCRTARADLLSESATLLSLRVVFVPEGSEQLPGACEDTDDYVPPTVLKVDLHRRLAGQAIGGPKRVRTKALWTDQIQVLRGSESRPRTFHLEGLGVADATDNLRAWGFKRASFDSLGPVGLRGSAVSAPHPRTEAALDEDPDAQTACLSETDGHARWAPIRCVDRVM